MAGQGSVYGSFEFAPKSFTRGEDIGRGQIGLPNINPPLFLEIRLIKSHTHTGVDSLQLQSEATPEMVKGYKTREREERGVAAWSGAAATNGSVVLTFATAFLEAPSVFVTPADGNANIIVGINTPTATAVTIYWRDESAATHTDLNLQYLIKGR